jgi:hypothetical protein
MPMIHSDDCTSVPLSSLRLGALFRTKSGWRGMKTPGYSLDLVNGRSYEDGGRTVFPADTPCWEITLGGWQPANAQLSEIPG